jgi:hypothetical protein
MGQQIADPLPMSICGRGCNMIAEQCATASSELGKQSIALRNGRARLANDEWRTSMPPVSVWAHAKLVQAALLPITKCRIREMTANTSSK